MKRVKLKRRITSVVYIMMIFHKNLISTGIVFLRTQIRKKHRYGRFSLGIIFHLVETMLLGIVLNTRHISFVENLWGSRVIYKEILVQFMVIEHSIFARSDAILSDQNAFIVSYNIIEEGLAKILLDKDDRASKFCPIICVFTRSYDRWSTL